VVSGKDRALGEHSNVLGLAWVLRNSAVRADFLREKIFADSRSKFAS
jgi:hypothetical protein